MCHSRLIVVVAALAASSGCAHVTPSPDAQAKQRYETYGPKFTEEEKAQMSSEEKVALYNSEVRKEDQLICRREKPIGSHFYRERCYTQKEREDMEDSASEFMREGRGNIPMPAPPGGT